MFERENDCKSWCALHVVLISIVFTISIGIGTYFIYYKYMNHDNHHPSSIKLFNIKQEILKKWTLKIELINFLMIWYYFDPNLLKTDKKLYKNIYIYYIGYITVKDSDYVRIENLKV